MNITELKELAEKATPGEWEVGKCLGDQSRHIYCVNPVNDGEEQWLPLIASTDDAETLVNFEANAAYIAAANPAAILELITQLEDAKGEIRALRATEAGLVEWVKELEDGLKSCHGSLKFLGDASDGDVSPKAWRKSGAEASELQALNLLLQNRALLEKKE